MRTSTLTYLSFIVFALALCAWAGTWIFYSNISSELSSRAQALSSSSAQNVQQENAAQLHALAEGTASNRAMLDQFVGTDVVGIANQIQAAGKSSGAETAVESATATTGQDPTSGTSELEFVIQSTGTFTQVWRAAQLFQALPLPSSVEELDFEQLPSATPGQSGSWQLTARLIVLTSAQISS